MNKGALVLHRPGTEEKIYYVHAHTLYLVDVTALLKPTASMLAWGM
jgi:hypothetical protein